MSLLCQVANNVDQGNKLSEIDHTVEQLTSSSLQLAEATANFGALKVVFGVFLAFMLLLLVVFVYQTLAMTKKVNDIHKTTDALNDYVKDSANRTLGKGQSDILLRRSYCSIAQTLKYTILRIRVENNIAGNKEFVSNKVLRHMNYEFTELEAFLANYECEQVLLSEFVKKEDARILTDFAIEQIYLPKEMFTVYGMDQAADILVNGMKIDATSRLAAI